jgi:hypothetical protein
MAVDGDDEAVIREALSALSPEGGVITHWVMVMEVFIDGDRDLHVTSSEGVTPWMALGMLEAAKMIAAEEDEE